MSARRGETTRDVELYYADRAGCSVNGNPTWELRTSGGSFRTSSDAAVGYVVGNYANRAQLEPSGRARVTLTLTSAGRVIRMRWTHDSTCGHCGRTWSSIETPTPAARCPFETEHTYPEEG